ncbi:glycosyltransferase [Streptococcus suis]|uniref:Cps23I n=1 Tax=Streptococcus suis TaxID=1307 RepID=G8DU96_STRSU|nr:glycosyltransferase [Streptococcus suis]AEH57597.1 Cps23I [Streptococcus suis]NQJ83594.1 glycosyltransferase [Streptococcus suis]NQL52553.1 glycosyltransferase [Streptococcus suis]WNF76203.1 glycosyltransferase [Streptococcus suis]HEM3186954.1 glycosyltransferase [Streptococcus suis 89-2479]
MRILQIYDHAGISSGIVSVIMSWHRSNLLEDVKFDFLFTKKIEPSYEEEILNCGGEVFYIDDIEEKSSVFTFIKKVNKFFEKNAYRYDGVHLHSANFAFPYLYFAKKYGIPLRILHVHSVAFGNNLLSGIRNIPLIYFNRFLANSFIACSTNAAKTWFGLLGISNFEIIPNPLEVEKYGQNMDIRREVRSQLNIKDDTIILGHVSNMTPLKEVPFIIDVLDRLRQDGFECKLVLIGKDVLPATVKDKINIYNLEQEVINLGVRSDIEMVLHAIDVCLMPSKSEGFGMVPLECQAADVPVIISKNFPKEIKASEKVSVLERDVELWSSEVVKMLPKRFVSNNLNNLKFNFSLQTVVPKLYKFYHRITE